MHLPVLTGLISILTPAITIMTIFLLIALSQFHISRRLRVQLILFFCLTVIGLYTTLAYIALKLPMDFSLNEGAFRIPSYLVYLLSLSFGIWLTGIFKNIIILDDRNRLLAFSFIIFLAILFTLNTISSTGPLLGSLLVHYANSQNLLANLIPIILFTLGMILPIGIIILLSQKMILKLKGKRWWEYFQFFSGISYIVLTIVGQTIK